MLLSQPNIGDDSNKWSPSKQAIRRTQLGRGLVERPRVFERVKLNDLNEPVHTHETPRAIILDCDGTLIWPETWLTEGPPYKTLYGPSKYDTSLLDPSGDGSVLPEHLCIDSVGRPIALFPAVVPLLKLLASSPVFASTSVHIASRSTEANWLHEILQALGVEESSNMGTLSASALPQPLHGATPNVYVDSSLSKADHVQRVAASEGVHPEECMLIDNERDQCDACQATCNALAVDCPAGLTAGTWNFAIEQFICKKRYYDATM